MIFSAPRNGELTLLVEGQEVEPGEDLLLVHGKKILINCGHVSLRFGPDAQVELSMEEKKFRVKVWKSEKEEEQKTEPAESAEQATETEQTDLQ
jgi:hypothetical protein